MSEQSNCIHFTNTNRWDTRQLVTMSLLCGIGVILSFIEFPLLPGVTWLKFDASMACAMVSGLAWGTGPGVAVGFMIAVMHGILMGDFVGAVLNILVAIGFVWPAAAAYARLHTFAGGVFSLTLGVIGGVIGALVGNLLLTPLWLGVPLDAVIAMIIPILIPFNALKGILNAVITMTVYKNISVLVKPKKSHPLKARGKAA